VQSCPFGAARSAAHGEGWRTLEEIRLSSKAPTASDEGIWGSGGRAISPFEDHGVVAIDRAVNIASSLSATAPAPCCRICGAARGVYRHLSAASTPGRRIHSPRRDLMTRACLMPHVASCQPRPARARHSCGGRGTLLRDGGRYVASTHRRTAGHGGRSSRAASGSLTTRVARRTREAIERLDAQHLGLLAEECGRATTPRSQFPQGFSPVNPSLLPESPPPSVRSTHRRESCGVDVR
jgi:hypothetical protein